MIRPILLICQDNNGYINVHPRFINISLKDVRKENRTKIPHGFTISLKNNDISLNVNMDVLEIHHLNILRIMKYWRYYLRCTGSININSHEEKIDSFHMAEYLIMK